MRKVILTSMLFIFITSIGLAKEIPFTLEDRDRLIKIEATLKEFKDGVDRRFEQVDKRFEQVDKRFEQVDKRFEQLMNFIWILASVFVGIVAVTIGFAIWDRRTTVRPFEVKTKEIERKIDELEKGKIERLILSLKELAKKDVDVAAVLKRFELL